MAVGWAHLRLPCMFGRACLSALHSVGGRHSHVCCCTTAATHGPPGPPSPRGHTPALCAAAARLTRLSSRRPPRASSSCGCGVRSRQRATQRGRSCAGRSWRCTPSRCEREELCRAQLEVHAQQVREGGAVQGAAGGARPAGARGRSCAGRSWRCTPSRCGARPRCRWCHGSQYPILQTRQKSDQALGRHGGPAPALWLLFLGRRAHTGSVRLPAWEALAAAAAWLATVQAVGACKGTRGNRKQAGPTCPPWVVCRCWPTGASSHVRSVIHCPLRRPHQTALGQEQLLQQRRAARAQKQAELAQRQALRQAEREAAREAAREAQRAGRLQQQAVQEQQQEQWQALQEQQQEQQEQWQQWQQRQQQRQGRLRKEVGLPAPPS